MTTLRMIASSTLLLFAIFGTTAIVAQIMPETAGTETIPPTPIVITGRVDDTNLVTLPGNTRPEVIAKNDRGRVTDSFPLEHMMLLLRRSPRQQHSLEMLTDRLHDSGSPDFHRWLTVRELGETYGLAHADIETITGWLSSHGFNVNTVYPNQLVVDFSGTAGQVRRAFHTEIHQLNVGGKSHIANMTDPRIPAALAPAVVGVVSLNDFMPQPTYQPRGYLTSGGNYYVVPADLATIYRLYPLFSGGISGQGQTIVLVEDSDVYSRNDWSTFRKVFGFSSSSAFTETHPAPPSGPTNCKDPGATGDDGEAILDAEWATAAAPNAAILMITCANTATSFGGFIALQNLLSAGNPPAIVSISYGGPETRQGAAENAFVNALYEQAVTAGVSVFVSTGDNAAAMSDPGANSAAHGINVNGLGSTVHNVAVGGTDFGDTYAGTNGVYWSATNDSVYGSALSYVPEIPWNDSCASVLISKFSGFSTTYGANGFCNSNGNGFLDTVGGSGGPSACATGLPTVGGIVGGTCRGYAKPSWQSVLGNPADGVRDLPDVSLFAANGVWGHAYVFCNTDPNGGGPCTGTPDTWSIGGGTSFASPIMAAIQSLINQATGQRWGNPNPTYYSLASAEYGKSGNSGCNSTLGNAVSSTCIFYDVTQGDMDVPCHGAVNCYLPSGTYGVLSTSNSAYEPAYGSQVGWDFATGIGTVNAYNLEQAFLAQSRLYKRNTALGEQVDYFGEGRADFTVWRPSNATFFSLDSSGSELGKVLGMSTDMPVIGDFDGDGKTDCAVWRPSTGTWYILQSSNGIEITKLFGGLGDVPVPGDYDGDGKTDIAVWRPSTGTWYILQSSNGQVITRGWGTTGDVPVPGDYDGDGKTDLAIWRPSNGTWFILQSSNDQEVTKGWGTVGDIPVPGDYDGDGKTDFAIWRPSDATWFIIQSSNSQEISKGWGAPGDVPVARDYDGDGKADFAVWRPSNGAWYVIQSSTGKTLTKPWGLSTDIPMNKPVGH
jgi:hypothetical protein